MAVPQAHAVAAVAGLAVKEVVSAANSADAALITVELILRCVIIKEVTLHAAVATKANPAVAAGCAHWLPGVTQSTHHLLDQPAIQCVPLFRVQFSLVLDVIVTVPAPEHLPAAGSYQLTPPLVMGTTTLHKPFI